jgi:hypothetical protein
MDDLAGRYAQEETAETWTAIGVIAALLGGLFYLSTRIDALVGRTDARFDCSPHASTRTSTNTPPAGPVAAQSFGSQ